MYVRREIHWLLVLGLGLSLCGCNQATGIPAPAEPVATMPAWAGPISDSDITNAVSKSLARDPIIQANDIKVKTTEGIVELTGTVSNLLSKRRAVRIAEVIKGVRAVSDRIGLDVPAVPDSDISQELDDVLLHNAVTKTFNFGIQVHDGAITLSGTVPSNQMRVLAGRLAEGIAGVRALNNKIAVAYTGAMPSDDELAARIQSRLYWDARLTDPLGVRVKDGSVSLEGTVGSVAEKTRAMADSWVDGVRSVDGDGLKVFYKPSLRRPNPLPAPPDIEIAGAVRDAAILDPRVASANFHVVVKRGTAILSGRVGSPAAKRAAEEIARDTVGVRGVEDQLEVSPLEAVDDAVIESNVEDVLSYDPYTGSSGIQVTTKDGNVTLSGTVNSPFERAEATDLAGDVEGVRGVANDLKVKRPDIGYAYNPYLYPYSPYGDEWYYAPVKAARSDSAIAKDVRWELAWSPFLDSSNIVVSVADGKATLKGTVRDRAERKAATADALAGGAVSVDNELKVAARAP